MFKEFINGEVKQLDSIDLNDLSEYGEGNLQAITIIKDWLYEEIPNEEIEIRLRFLIKSLKINVSKCLRGQLETYRYAYFKLLVEMGYLDSNLEEDD